MKKIHTIFSRSYILCDTNGDDILKGGVSDDVYMDYDYILYDVLDATISTTYSFIRRYNPKP